MSEVDVGSMAVEAEPSHQYSIMCCCRVTDGSRGAVWQNDIWCRSADEAKVCNWILLWRKNDTLWHSSVLAEHLCRPNSGCEHSEMVGGAFQQWQQWQWAVLAISAKTQWLLEDGLVFLKHIINMMELNRHCNSPEMLLNLHYAKVRTTTFSCFFPA